MLFDICGAVSTATIADRYLHAAGFGFIYWPHWKQHTFRPYYLIAMKTLGIPPILAGESWPVPEEVEMPLVRPGRWGLWFPRGFNKTTRYLSRWLSDYRMFDAATEDARRDLATRGIQIPEIDPDEIDEPHHFNACGKPVSWRQWWMSKPDRLQE
jgi:hypothetical protein